VSVAQFLVDVSAWVRYPCPRVAARLDEMGANERLATCSIVELQLLAVLENAATYARVAKLRRQAYPVLEMTNEDPRRALEVQALLADAEQPGVPWAVLLVAAVAERHGVTVLHGYRCFDLVSRMTGQAVEWVVLPEMDTPLVVPESLRETSG
jgi:predicted nucleic acid-binding protein